MTRLPSLRNFLRALIGLPMRSAFFGIDRCAMNDIESARWKRAMRESAASSAKLLGRYFRHLDAGGSGLAFMLEEFPEAFAPPQPRPVVYPPSVYRALLARSGASLRPPRRSGQARMDGDLVLDERGDLVPSL